MTNLHKAWELEQTPNGRVQIGATFLLLSLAHTLHPQASAKSFARLSRALIRRQTA